MRSLQARMFLVFALIATLPLPALSYLALAQTRDALVREVGAAHEDAADAAAGFVDVYVESGRIHAETAARSEALGAAWRDGNGTALADELAVLYARSTFRESRVFSALVVLDGRGVVLAAHPASAATERPGVLAALEGSPPGRAKPLPVPERGPPVLPLAVRAATDGPVLVGDLDLAALGRALQGFAPGGARTVYVLDEDGRVVYHPDARVLAERPEWSSSQVVESARRRDGGFLEYADPATGEVSFGAFTRIRGLGWIVATSMPSEEAYTALRSLTAVLIVLSGLLAGGILLASVVLARRIVRPVEELTEAARALAEGKLHRRIPTTSRDEIGQLGEAFNDMAARIGESLEGLRRSEQRYRNLIESANDLIFTIQPDGTLSFLSPLAHQALGRRPQEMVGRPALDFVPPSDADAFREAVEGVLRTGEPVFFVPHRLVAADGSTRTVLTTFSPVFEGGRKAARVLGVARDVTQERRQEMIREKTFQMARLVSEEAGLATLAGRGLGLMLDVVGLRRGVAYIGGGESPKEAASAGPPLPAPTRAALARLAADATRAREPRRAVVPGLPAGALAVPLLERGEPLGAAVLVDEERSLVAENQDVLAALASQLAVGLRRSLFEERLRGHAAELESRVAERTRELTEKSREMEQFLYSVSHDLKAPLISIQGYAQSLEEDFGTRLDEDGRFYLERIRRNATLMESLILDILELSRIGRIRERPEDVDLHELLADVGARLGDRFAQAGGSLVVAPGLPRVHGERNRLDQLFTNLLDNALKYRHPERPPRVEVEGERAGAQVRVRVRDNGRGIPREHHDKLFEVFQRIPAPGMEDPGGTGIGLAIVKRIVDTHGGSVRVESEEGVGTTFHLLLPAEGVLP